jgi:site-specific DNA-methyltransferase (adenine-specific)
MNVTLQYRIGDVFDRLAEIPDSSIDLIVSSPPFLALRSYLPDDHPDKGKEIGQEPTPAAFIDTHLALAAEYARVLAPHGTLCYEIGDTYSGSSAGEGSSKWRGYDGRGPRDTSRVDQANLGTMQASKGNGWPLAKSMCIIPHMFTGSLAYGRNLLTGKPSPAGEWRIRNVICWARPNPPVGALGDKFRPATSYITVACKGKSRYFDLDAVRTALQNPDDKRSSRAPAQTISTRGDSGQTVGDSNPAGAPPLDWHADNHPEDGDWLWKLTTQPYKGSHFATFPMALPKKMIEAMCPLKVCTVCGVPSTRITERTPEYAAARAALVAGDSRSRTGYADVVRGGSGGESFGTGGGAASLISNGVVNSAPVTTGWTDCGHDAWRPGVVLDPFGGSGTTAEAAQAVGRSAILIDLDDRNAHLAQQRVGMFLEIDTA